MLTIKGITVRLLTCERVRRGSFDSVGALKQAVERYLQENNENPKPFVWKADAETIFGKIERRLSGRTLHAGH